MSLRVARRQGEQGVRESGGGRGGGAGGRRTHRVAGEDRRGHGGHEPLPPVAVELRAAPCAPGGPDRIGSDQTRIVANEKPRVPQNWATPGAARACGRAGGRAGGREARREGGGSAPEAPEAFTAATPRARRGRATHWREVSCRPRKRLLKPAVGRIFSWFVTCGHADTRAAGCWRGLWGIRSGHRVGGGVRGAAGVGAGVSRLEAHSVEPGGGEEVQLRLRGELREGGLERRRWAARGRSWTGDATSAAKAVLLERGGALDAAGAGRQHGSWGGRDVAERGDRRRRSPMAMGAC